MEPVNPIYNQVYITGTRSIYEAYKEINPGLFLQNIIRPIVEYWPDTLAHQVMYVENLKTLNNYEEAEFWALKIGKSQMEDNYFSELHCRLFINKQEILKNIEKYMIRLR